LTTTTMSLPQRTTFLVVGAGPSGLACAISLVKHGCSDVVLVDAVVQGENTSRALAIHAATLEVCCQVWSIATNIDLSIQSLDTVGCADSLVKAGLKGQGLAVRVGAKTLIGAQFSYIAQYTRFPYVLILPQNITERILGEHVQDLNIQVFRPYKVTDMKVNQSDDNVIDVSFETGEVIEARYVIGADGARSIV
jgi:2-polyprenyl-6-methoxyphenol hydroxylase-like FAD-dependent oxidoreductase